MRVDVKQERAAYNILDVCLARVTYLGLTAPLTTPLVHT